MDKKNILSILRDVMEEEIPSSQVNLLPAVKASLVAKISIQQGEKINKRKSGIVFALIVIVILAMIFITPQGRAFAQSLFRFFSTTESISFPLPDEQLPLNGTPIPAPTFELSLGTSDPLNSEPAEPTAAPLPISRRANEVLKYCQSKSDTYSYDCQIAQAESQLGFDIREFPFIPRGLAFVNTEVNTTLRMVTVNYSVIEGGGYLTLTQGVGIIQTSNWGNVPADAIQQIYVGKNYAEFAQGQFVVMPGSQSATWNAEAKVLRLRWAEGNRWLSLEKMGDPYLIEYLDQDALIALAANLVDDPGPQANTALDDSYNLSVVDAEAGFDLLEPSIIPESFELAYTRYDKAQQTVMLFYKPRDQTSGSGGLYFFETPHTSTTKTLKCEECPTDTVENIQVNNTPAFYWQGNFDNSSGSMVWQDDASFYILQWTTIDLNITLNYSMTEWYGGQLTKGDLIKIAESMR